MARFRIYRKNGQPTQYFWTDKDGTDATRKTVYKQSTEGVKRMRGVTFDTVAKQIRKD